MQKVFNVAVDIGRKLPAPAFEVNTNDLKSVKLLITITNGQTLLNLTDTTVRIAIRKPDNNILFQDCTVKDAKIGQVEIVLENQAYIMAGTHTAEIMCYKGSEVVAVSGTFSYKSTKGIMNDEAVESRSEFTTITGMLKDVQDTIEDFRENGTGIDTKARQDIQSVTAQLAVTKSQIEINYPYLTNFFKALEKGNATIVFLGDSTTEANDANNNIPHPKYLQDWFNSKYGAGKVTVINSGVSGNDLSLMSNRIPRDVLSKNPDCVVICSGWNDTNLQTFDIFEYRYNTIIELIKAGSTKPLDIVLRTPNYSANIDYVKPLEENIPKLTEKVAKRNNVGLVDYFYYSKTRYKNGEIELDPTAPNTTMTDNIHPNQKGQELIGDFLKPMFDINGKLGKVLNGVSTKYSGLYIEATNTSLVNNNGYAVSTTDQGHIRYKRLATSSAFPNKVASLNFYGTAVKVVVKSGKNMGMINVAIDGGTPVKYDLYEVQRNTVGLENFKIIEISGLSNDAHIITVTALAEKNSNVTGNSEIYVDGFIVDETSFYAYKFKNESVAAKYEALVRYSASDNVTKTTVITPNTSILLEFDMVVLNDGSRFIPITDKACTVENSGLYIIEGSVSIATATNRGVLQIMRNGGFLAQQSFYFDNVTPGDRNIKISTIARLNVGDKISLQVSNHFNSESITVKNYNNPGITGIKVYRIGS